MILKSFSGVERQRVTMAGAQRVEMQLLCGPGDGCDNFAMRRFIVEAGGCTPKHQHDYEHEVLVLAGEGVAFGNGREQPVKAGDVVIVPANELHQFRNTGKSAMEFICMVPAFVHRPGAPVPVAVNCAMDAAAGKTT
jgi:quercetin dioxygenase-like cupin family protein